MRAAVIHVPGGPEVLKLEDVPIPTPSKGQVLIRVKACGLNRSELFTRKGDSGPAVPFPRILGIEACGLVEEAPGGEFKKGEIVATAMGGLGRVIDGGYAEYTCVPASHVVAIKTELDWSVLGAVPEMLQTAYGSLFTSLKLQKGDKLLVRGGTSSVGLAAAAIAKNHGATVAGTTRKAGREGLLKGSGCDHVIIDNGKIAEEVRKIWPDGADKVLELVGTTSLLDSLASVSRGGICCMTGMVSGAWAIKDFEVMGAIPTAVGLTTYQGDEKDFVNTPLEEMVQQIKAGTLKVQIGKTFPLEEIVEAHRTMDENRAGGKIVLLM
ncbi:hypothetical protein P7C71_g5038, partial [Lecanoromycetidae sp. Uapishka_2]